MFKALKKHSGNHIIVLNFTLHTCIAGKKKKKKKKKDKWTLDFLCLRILEEEPAEN